MDTEELAIVPLIFLDEWGPLVTLKGETYHWLHYSEQEDFQAVES